MNTNPTLYNNRVFEMLMLSKGFRTHMPISIDNFQVMNFNTNLCYAKLKACIT